MKTIFSPHSSKKTVRNTVIATASVVTFLSIAERALGFLYRIVLSRLIGAEGLGLYQVALSLFSVFLTIGTGGIPITVSRLISKSKAENDVYGERSAVGAGACLCLFLTLPIALILGIFPKTVGFLFTDERCVSAFRILLLGLTFSSLYAVVRGSFWGNKQFLTPSVLEIAEEAVMVIAGVLLLQGVTSAVDGANRAAWAVVISYTFSFTASTVCFFLFGGKLAKPNKQLKPLFRATVPITSVRASSSIVNSAVAVLLPAMLVRAGASSEEALSLLGIVSGMAMPVLFIPSTIIGSLSLVLVPELAEDFYRKNTRRLYQNISRGLSVTLLVSLCLIPFFYAFGGDLGSLAFSEPLVGEFIKKGSLILLPMSLTMITTGMLNSMGFEKQTFLYYFAGAAAMLLCILFLPAVCGAYAYVWGLGASFTLNAVLNLFLLHKKCNGLYKSMWQGRGQGSVQPLLRALLLVLPIALCGSLSLALFKRVFGQFFALVLSGVCTGILTLGLWCALGVLPLKNLIKLRAKK